MVHLRHFTHEFRVMARENRWLIPLPTLIPMVGVLLWHLRWVTEYAKPQFSAYYDPTLSLTLNTLWPAIGWLLPYGMLKRFDPKAAHALWRTGPIRPQEILGARLLLTAGATVLLPALTLALLLWRIAPELVASQVGAFTLLQLFMFAVGAVAAFAGEGHRGLAILPLTVALWATADSTTTMLMSQLGRLRESQAAFMTALMSNPWGELSDAGLLTGALLLTLAVLVRYPAARLSPKPWFLGTALLAASGGAFRLLCAETLLHPHVAETLPAIHAELRRLTPEQSAAENRLDRLDYEPALDKKTYLASARLTLPAGEFGSAINRYRMLDGDWLSEHESGRLATRYFAKSPRLCVRHRYESPLASAAYENDAMSFWNLGAELVPATAVRWANAFHALHPEKDWVILGTRHGTPTGIRLPVARFAAVPPTEVLLAVDPTTPEPDRIRATLPLIRYGVPTTVLRTPLNRAARVERPEKLFDYAPGERMGILSLRQRLGPINNTDWTPDIFAEHVRRYAFLLIHPERHELVMLLDHDSLKWHGSADGIIRMHLGQYWGWSGLDKTWVKSAELLVLSLENDRAVDVPLELTLPDVAKP